MSANASRIPPMLPIGNWERLGWDEWHGGLDWERRQREARESRHYIMTGHFTPIRPRAPRRWLSLALGAPAMKVFALVGACGTVFVAGRYVLHWL